MKSVNETSTLRSVSKTLLYPCLAVGALKGGALRNISITLLSAMLLTGCSLHSARVHESSVDVPSSFSIDTKTPAPPLGRWWEGFGDEKLNALMEQVFRQNLDIRQAYERLQQSRAVAGIADSARGPVVNLEGSGGRARQTSAGTVRTDDVYRLSAAARFELDLWGKLKSQSEAARLEALASEEALRSLFISISARAADLYFLAAEQQLQIELSDRTIASFQDTLDRVERRYREGLVPAIDVYQSRQNLSSAKAQRPLFMQNRAVTLNALSVLSGQVPADETGGAAVLPEAPLFNAGLPSQLLERRPDVKAAFLRIQANDKRVSAAIADRLPSFNLAGSYGGASDRVRTVLDSPNIFWNILLEAAQPVIDSGRRRAEVARTEAVLQESLAAYYKAVLEALADVEDALARGAASEERITMLKDTAASSEASLRLALDRYLQGLTDYLPVLTEQLRHFTAQSNLLAARRQLISDRIQLARSLGGEWADSVSDDYVDRMAER